MSKRIVYTRRPDAPPPWRIRSLGLAREWRIGLEATRLAVAMPRLAAQPTGSAPVLLIPGWLSPELSLSPLRVYLRTLGYAAHHWGFGINRGDPEEVSAVFGALVQRVAAEVGRRVMLVGWSLGGVVARETARRVPQAISGIVTFGTPVVGGPLYTIGADLWEPSERARFAARSAVLDAERPIQVPIAAIFSRRDEIVAWPACIDRVSPHVTHIEVDSPHMAMCIDPAVWRTVAQQLHAFARTSAQAVAG